MELQRLLPHSSVPQQREDTSETIRNDLQNTTLTIIANYSFYIVLFLFAIGTLIFTVFNLNEVDGTTSNGFKAITFQGNQLINIDGVDVDIVRCTNNSLGNETIFFNKTTLISKLCEPTDDVCRSNVCLSNGICSVVFNDPSFNCSGNSDCDTGKNCVDCICTPRQSCSAPKDCGEIFWTDCLMNDCVDGFCQQDFTSGSECVSGVLCGDRSRCRDCQCIPGSTDQCENDGECETVEWSSCFSSFCEMGTCVSRTLSNTTCVTDGECGEGFKCRDCNCEEIQCSSNEECGVIEWTTCLENVCVNGECIQNLTNTSQCVSMDECQPGFECKNCTCQEKNVQCFIDGDCPSLNYTSCVENICVNQVCIPVLPEGNDCSDSSFCNPGEFCDANCQCMPTAEYVLVQDDVAQVVGSGATFGFSFRLYVSGNQRLLTFEEGFSVQITSSTITTTSAAIAPPWRPSDLEIRRSVTVFNDGRALGRMSIFQTGEINWFVGGQGAFSAGATAGFLGGSVTWVEL